MNEQLRQLELFSQLSSNDFERIQSLISVTCFDKDEMIIRQGDVGEQLYIIKEGTVSIEMDSPHVVQITTLGIGQFFGEMSCLTSDPISANVRAMTTVTAYLLNREGMLQLMDASSDFRNYMIESMVKRISNSNKRVVEEHSKNLYIMRRNELSDREKYGELIGHSQQITGVRESLDHAAKQERLIVVTGEKGVGKTHVAKRIHYSSARQNEPLIETTLQQINWNEWEPLLAAVGNGTLLIDIDEVHTQEQLHAIIQRCERHYLIITSEQPLNVHHAYTLHIPPLRERSQDITELAMFYLQKEVDNDVIISEEALRTLKLFPYLTENVAELISVVESAYLLSEGSGIQASHLKFTRKRPPGVRPKIGIALGSGSLRGISHIGVLNILEAEGIPIDYIAGTSVGSLVGGLYAAGISSSQIMEETRRLKWHDIVKFTIPKRSIFHNTPTIQSVERVVGDVKIEQLKIPFAAVASDANSGEAHIIRHGSLAQSIAASTAIPAIVRPVQFQKRTLIDGAVIHPVPAALVRSMGADVVIAVNICSEKYTKGIPKNFINSLLSTIDMMSAKIVKEELQLANIVLRPNLDHIVNGLKDREKYFAAGIEVTKDRIEEIKSLCLT